MKTTGRFVQVAALLLMIAIVTPCWADGASLDLSALAERAQARQSAIEAQLQALNSQTAPAGMDANTFAANQATERARLEDLKARNAKVVEGYQNHMGSTSSSSGPAEASSGGIMDKVTGFFKGGSSSESGPTSVAFGASSMPTSAGGIGQYLKENWPGLVGGTAGSIGGYYLGKIVGSRFGGIGGTVGGIVGSVALGWLGQKAGEWLGNKFLNRGGGSQQYQAPNPGYQGQNQAYGSPVYNQGYGGYAGVSQVPMAPAANIYEARDLMQQRYQAFVAASGTNADPALRAAAYSNYMAAKAQFEQMQTGMR
ncbi:MAG: hypothetical protein HY815_29650 [Candidatus Riflebacteria bacterium]|nr:hypothetical protein [Candidatus Riflebacteria bacterium]